MKKLILVAALFLPSLAHAGLEAKAGNHPLMYSQNSTAGNLTSNDLSDIRAFNVSDAKRVATNFCVRAVWNKAAEANIRLDLNEDATDLPGTNSDQYNEDIMFSSHKNVEIIIKSCIEAKTKSIIKNNQ